MKRKHEELEEEEETRKKEDTPMMLVLPEVKQFQGLCKAIAVLDAIFCQEWESRYYCSFVIIIIIYIYCFLLKKV